LLGFQPAYNRRPPHGHYLCAATQRIRSTSWTAVCREFTLPRSRHVAKLERAVLPESNPRHARYTASGRRNQQIQSDFPDRNRLNHTPKQLFLFDDNYRVCSTPGVEFA
jgi:hypothetical protein